MVEIKSTWKTLTNKKKWAVRGASFVAKAKATKLVWFPPKPAQAGTETASTVTQATKDTTETTAGAAKRMTDSTKRMTDSTKKVTNAGTPEVDVQHPGG